MVLAEIPQLEKFATDTEPFYLLCCWEETLPLRLKIIATLANAAPSALRVVIDEVIILAEVSDLLLKIVNRAIQVVGALLQHVQSLVTTSLVVQNDNDEVAVDFLAFRSNLLE